MSNFSEKCKELVRKNNTNVYQLAKYSGMERTALQKMISGSRLPASIDKVKEFCACLQLSISEEKELVELYKMEKVGKNIYESRKEIKVLISSIQQYQSNWESIVEIPSNEFHKTCGLQEKKDVRSFEYNLDIEEAIHYVIASEMRHSEDAYIAMNVFEKNDIVYQRLIVETQSSGKSVVLNQYVNFIRSNSDDTSTIENIRILKSVIAFAFAFPQKYKVHYSYIVGDREECREQIWPNYLITTDKVLLLSGDCTRALLIENIELVKGYYLELWNIEKRYRTLFEMGLDKNNMEESLQQYQKSVNGEYPEYVFSSHLDVYPLYYPQLLEREKENPYIDFMYNLQQMNHQNSNVASVNYFGLLEIESFIESGKLPGIYGEYTRNYNIEERRLMLNNYLKSLSEGTTQRYLLKEDAFDYKSLINIEMYDSKRLYFLSIMSAEKGNNPLKFIEIKEKGICVAFYDYFEYLKESEKVYDSTITTEEMRKRINQIWSTTNKKEA